MFGILVFILIVGRLLLGSIRCLFPANSRVRLAVEAWATSIRENPERFGKKLQYFAGGLVALVFLVITLVYS